MTATLPRSLERRTLPVNALAAAYQAAAAAGERSPSKQLDRALQAEWYPDGIALIGMSLDLVVCAQVAYTAGSPGKLYEQVLEADPLMRVVVNDTAAGGRGRSTLKDAASRSNALPKGSSPIRATFYVDEVIPEGAMVGTKYLRIAVDGMTDGELIALGYWSPGPWRDGMPDSQGAPLVPTSALLREPPGAFARLGRITKHLPVVEDSPLDWEFHTLASGRTVRYLRLDGDHGTVEVTVACALNGASGALPVIFAEHTDDDEDETPWDQPALGVVGDDGPDAEPDPSDS